MRHVTVFLQIRTPGPGLHPIDAQVKGWLEGARYDGRPLRHGLMTLLCQHTSASLTIQENADPDVRRDLSDAMERLAPRGGPELYRHHAEGPDDMPAHIRTVLSGVHLSIPVFEGRLALGPWQGLYLWEHRDAPQLRRIAVHLLRD